MRIALLIGEQRGDSSPHSPRPGAASHTGTGKEAGARQTSATQLRPDPPTNQTPTTRPEDYVAETGAHGRQNKENLAVGHITQPST
jgi:hypothetical protein